MRTETELVEHLNGKLYEAGIPEDVRFSYHTDGFVEHIELAGNIVWDSENSCEYDSEDKLIPMEVLLGDAVTRLAHVLLMVSEIEVDDE